MEKSVGSADRFPLCNAGQSIFGDGLTDIATVARAATAAPTAMSGTELTG